MASDDTDAVVVAYVHDNSVTYSWHHSIMELLAHDLTNHQRVMRGGWIAMRYGTDGIVEARNKTARTFLNEKNADWLFICDTDMGFAPDTIDRLLEKADPVERPVVGALAFSWREEESDGMGGWRHLPTPTIFHWGQDGNQEGFIVDFGYQPDALQKVGATGSACLLIHRSVFEKIAEKFDGDHWYDRYMNPKMNKLISEDLSFCMRASMVGCSVWVDTSVKTTHAKTIFVSETNHYSQLALAQMVPQVPAATEATAIIVPVLGRPQNAAPFMESFRAAGPYPEGTTVYPVCDWSDRETFDAWLDAGAVPIHIGHGPEDPPGTFAQKVNWAWDIVENEPWIFLAGDDVRFHPNWLDHAQQASRDGAHVIGTNDMKNPRVIKGEHATHLLIRRNYIDERGASWDGPGAVCHEGYGHWYVDDEIVTVAKQRGVWAFAKHSAVEHLHPLWGGAEMDETYELGKSRAPADKELFEQRVAEHAQ